MFEFAKAKQAIERRNQIRRDANLPAISVAEEVRRHYEFHRAGEFEQFFSTSPIRARVEQRLLERERRRRANPEWMPNGMLSGGGWAFHIRTRRLLRRIWRMQ